MADLERIAEKIINAGAVEIRDVDNGEEPFVYSTGNRGPGYVMIKGLVGQPSVMKFLTGELAYKVVAEADFDFIEGNATGGMVPAWQLRNDVSEILGEEVPYCYLRGSRKEGGHGELITGDRNNPEIRQGMSALVFEELVNYAGTTSNAAEAFREAGYPVSHAACILTYDHPESNKRLEDKDVNLVPLIKLPDLLDVAESNGHFSSEAVNSYKNFLADPMSWQLDRDLAIPEDSARRAIDRGYNMVPLPLEKAMACGAPKKQLESGVTYWGRE